MPNSKSRVRTHVNAAEAERGDTLPGLSNFANMNLAIEYRAVTELHMPARQLRKHKQRQVEQIAASIRQFGFNDPVLIDDDDRIIAGVGRVLAAPLVGLARIPVVRLSHLSAEEVRAYAIAENRLAERSEWDSELLALELGELSALNLDFDLELTGFDTAQIDIAIAGTTPASNSDDDPVEIVAGPAISQAGDLWQLGVHRLLCGDAREGASYERVMGDDRAQMVFADPPYNVRIEGNVCGLGSVTHAEFAMASGEITAAEGSVRANAPAVKPAAVGQANATPPKARQSISLFQLVAGYNPARRVDVRSLPLFAA